MNDNDHDNHTEEPTLLRKSTRVRNATEFYGQLVNAFTLEEHDEPANYKEAIESPESEKWLQAMRSEIDSMYANKVWTLVDIPEDRKAVENKWIFKKILTLMETYPSTKLDSSRKVFDKFKELTAMKPSHP